MKTNDLLMLGIVGFAAYFLYTHWSTITGGGTTVPINPVTGQTPGINPLTAAANATQQMINAAGQPTDASGNVMGPGY